MKRFVLVPYEQHIRSQAIINRKIETYNAQPESAMRNNSNDIMDDTPLHKERASNMDTSDLDTSKKNSDSQLKDKDGTNGRRKHATTSKEADQKVNSRKEAPQKLNSQESSVKLAGGIVNTDKLDNTPIIKKRKEVHTPPEDVLKAAINDSSDAVNTKTITSEKIWIIS
jgi:hypothetical protein